MKKALVVLAIIAGLLTLFLVVSLLASAITGPSTLDYARQSAEIESLQRQSQIDRSLTGLDLLLAAAWRLFPLVVAVGLVGYLGAMGVAHVIRFRNERQPDSRGLLPVNSYQLDTVAPVALGAYHGARQLEAGRQLVPHTITYAPHNTHRLDYRGDTGGAALPALAEPTTTGAPVPSFAQLLDSGRVGRGNPLLLGYDDEGKPVEGSWLQLYSCAVGGLSGSGKSWTATFLAAQAALYGSRIVLLDPHAADPQSLAQRLAPMRARFVCEVASEPAAMRAAVDLVAGELARRKAGRRGDSWLFIADEFSALQRGDLADPLAALVEGLGQEGRKLGLYAMVCGQVWSAARAGGTELRDSLASAYVHRLRPAQARMLTGLSTDELPGDLLQLPAGCAYLLDTAGDLRRVTIPEMHPSDVARVAQLLEGGAPSTAPSAAPSTTRTIGFRPARREGALEGALEGANSAPLPGQQEAPNWTPEEAAILAALRDGKTPGEVAAELAGASGGRKYQEAARRVADIVRRLAQVTGAAQ